ncbi:thymidylate kinase [Methanococcus maripaludis]|uniref:Thymidylate kinase n=1 Tax=Methanococcus maripaludis TaxID=39152 RepID=A0A7J9NS58_METMI|nr:hypothetical protein [Methanococcus maripaludis]MBA2850510.1 thymidylate kinase [Methanococcus maripaludis]
MDFEKILNEIIARDLGIILRTFGDYDIWSNKLPEISELLLNNDFIKTYENNYKIKFSKFMNERLIVFDIVKDWNYISENFFYSFSIKKEIIDNYLKNTKNQKEFSSSRYLVTFRNDKIDFFKNNFESIDEVNALQNNYTEHVFKNKFSSYAELTSFLNRNIFLIFKKLKLKYFLMYIVYRFSLYLKIFFRRAFERKIFVITGYDGSGKTTISNILRKELDGEYVYFGTKRFFNRAYYKMLNVNILLKLIRLFLVYFDFLSGYCEILFKSIKKEYVFVDRYPKMEILSEGFLSKISRKLLFTFYPSPKTYFILYNSPEVILSRKKELSENEINKLNSKLLRIQQKRAHIIKNDEINKTLNTILKEIFTAN